MSLRRCVDHRATRAAVVVMAATVLGIGGCSGGGGGTPGSGTGGVATGTGGATAGSGGAGTGGMTAGSGGAGSGGAGTGGASVDAPTMDAPMEAGAEVPAGPFALTSSAFTMGMEIPLMHKCSQAGNNPVGMNISPPLSWTPGPAGTMSYAITLIHDAPDMSQHWAIWDIPADTFSLPANIDHVAMPPTPAGSKQERHPTALDGFVGYGYLGPCPQMPNARQYYLFTLYAIRTATIEGITPESSIDAIFTAIRNNAVSPNASATLRGSQIRN
jgi:Raf kinase inhibitor-like YbhB/YbcL family protein